MTPAFEIREMVDADLPEVIALLCEGFPSRTPDYWRSGFQRLTDRERPPSTEKFGYVLVSEGVPQGVVLTIPSVHQGSDGPMVMVNMSSWFARPAFRGAPAKDLFRHGCRRDDISYTDLSAAPHTMKAILSFGFREWTAGQVVALSLHRADSAKRAQVLTVDGAASAGLSDAEVAVLADHERLGCVSICLETGSGLLPMVFVRRRIKGLVPCAQLIYCDDLERLVEHGRLVWSWFARKGLPLLLVDASAPVPGLIGRYVPGKASKYIKGPLPTKAVDHTYSEMTLLGF